MRQLYPNGPVRKHSLPSALRRIVAAALLLPLFAAAPAARAADIVDTAVQAGSFETLVAALQAADLVEALQGPGPFTVFAPTDEAFAKLPKGTVESLLKPENKGQLAAILKYHVVSGRIDSAAAVQAASARTLESSPVRISIRDGQLRINDARVVRNDLDTSNGIIHVIDSVLLPPDRAAASGRKILGVYFERPNRALAAQLALDRHGSLLITRVTSGGNARAAGIERYDVITEINGRPASNDSLKVAKAETSIGDPIELRGLRQGRPFTLAVPVGITRH